MPRFRPVSVVPVVAAAALCSWALAGLSAWAYVDPRGLAIEVGAGTALSVIAALLWRDDERARHDRERERLEADMSILVMTLAGVVPPRPVTRTVPFPRAL